MDSSTGSRSRAPPRTHRGGSRRSSGGLTPRTALRVPVSHTLRRQADMMMLAPVSSQNGAEVAASPPGRPPFIQKHGLQRLGKAGLCFTSLLCFHRGCGPITRWSGPSITDIQPFSGKNANECSNEMDLNVNKISFSYVFS